MNLDLVNALQQIFPEFLAIPVNSLSFKVLIHLLCLHIEDHIVEWDEFACHPLRETIIGFGKTCPTIELRYQVDDLLAKFG